MPITYTALTTLPGRAPAEALSEALENLDPSPTGVGTFEMEDGSGLWEVGGYFLERPDDVELALLAAANNARPFTVSIVPETDWVAHVRRELVPVPAGRFFVYGSHDTDALPEDKIGLLIEAAMAFGTGHHGTTLGCLLSVDRLISNGLKPRAVADIGCGTAVLAMAAAKIWDVPVLASDIDPVAVEVAEANLSVNDLAGRVACLEATGFDHPKIAEIGPFDLVFANILKGPLIALAPDVAANLTVGGFVILSGLLNEQAAEVEAAYRAQGFELDQALVKGEWTTLTMKR